MSLIHQANIAGFGKKIELKEFLKFLKPGTIVAKVFWDGCMAEIRNETDRGPILRHERRNDSDGIIVKYSTGENWEAYSELIIDGTNVEAWH